MWVGGVPARCTEHQRQNHVVRRHGSSPEEDVGLGQRQDEGTQPHVCNLHFKWKSRLGCCIFRAWLTFQVKIRIEVVCVFSEKQKCNFTSTNRKVTIKRCCHFGIKANLQSARGRQGGRRSRNPEPCAHRSVPCG